MKTLGLVLLTLWAGASMAQGQFRGDAAHSGVFAGAAPQRTPQVKWTFPTGDRIVSSPVLHGGTLFFGSDDGHLYAVDVATGRERWRFRTGGPVAATPAVDGGRVFVGSYDGKFYALDAASGALVWKFASEGEKRFEARGLHGFLPRRQTYADPFDVYLSSPVVADGAVFFGSGDGHVYALSAADGQRRWTFDAGEVVHASPAVVDGVVYVGSWNSRFFALDARSGSERWRFQAGTDDLIHNQVGFQSSPAVVDGTVYVGCRDANLYALDAATGREKWRYPTNGSWVVTSPAVSAGRVVFATSDSSLVTALDAATGQQLWQQSTRAYVFASPAVAGDVVLTGVLNGILEARSLSSGALLWEFRTETSRANEGWALDASGRFNGGLMFPSPWRESALGVVERQSRAGSFFSSPLVAAGTVYIGAADGRVYAIE